MLVVEGRQKGRESEREWLDEGALVDHEATTNGAHIGSSEHGPEGARGITAQSLVLLVVTRGIRRRTHAHGAWCGARSSKQLVCDSCGESASRVIVIFLPNEADTVGQNELYRTWIDSLLCVPRTYGYVHGISVLLATFVGSVGTRARTTSCVPSLRIMCLRAL